MNVVWEWSHVKDVATALMIFNYKASYSGIDLGLRVPTIWNRINIILYFEVSPIIV